MWIFLDPLKIGYKTVDNLIQTIVWAISSTAISISMLGYCLTLDGLEWNIQRVLNLFAFSIGSWASGFTSYRLGLKTRLEWGS
jgi:hypothetical protein